MGAARPAAGEAEQAHEAAGPQAVAGDGLVGVFGACREMAARIADETGQGELVEPHERGADDAPRRLRPRAGPVARTPVAGHRPPPVQARAARFFSIWSRASTTAS